MACTHTSRKHFPGFLYTHILVTVSVIPSFSQKNMASTDKQEGKATILGKFLSFLSLVMDITLQRVVEAEVF